MNLVGFSLILIPVHRSILILRTLNKVFLVHMFALEVPPVLVFRVFLSHPGRGVPEGLIDGPS